VHLKKNPEVAKKAAEKGWITKDLYRRAATPARPAVSESKIKNQDEHIIEEVLDYLLGKMEIL